MKTRIKKITYGDGRVKYECQEWCRNRVVAFITVALFACCMVISIPYIVHGLFVYDYWQTIYTAKSEEDARFFIDEHLEEIRLTKESEKEEALKSKVVKKEYIKYP